MRGYNVTAIQWQRCGTWGIQKCTFPRRNPSSVPWRHDGQPDIQRGFVRVWWRRSPDEEPRGVTTTLTVAAARRLIRTKKSGAYLNEEEKELREVWQNLLFDEQEVERLFREALSDLRRTRDQYAAEIQRRDNIRKQWFDKLKEVEK